MLWKSFSVSGLWSNNLSSNMIHLVQPLILQKSNLIGKFSDMHFTTLICITTCKNLTFKLCFPIKQDHFMMLVYLLIAIPHCVWASRIWSTQDHMIRYVLFHDLCSDTPSFFFLLFLTTYTLYTYIYMWEGIFFYLLIYFIFLFFCNFMERWCICHSYKQI